MPSADVTSATDECVRRKVHTALKHGIRPLVCIGERLDERESGLEKGSSAVS
jgi:triosephosphate isomerase